VLVTQHPIPAWPSPTCRDLLFSGSFLAVGAVSVALSPKAYAYACRNEAASRQEGV
jgi:hypothetical protein